MKPASAYPKQSVWTLRHASQNPVSFVEQLAALGDVVPFSLAGHQAFLLNHPDHVENVLVLNAARYAKPRAFERAGALLGRGLLTSDGELHRERRRIAQPAFSPNRLEIYSAVATAAASRVAGSWRDGETIDLAAAMQGLTLDVMGRLLFSADLSAEKQDIGRAMAAAAASLDPLLSLVAPRRELRRAGAYLRSLVGRFIDDRAASDENRDDMLSLLLRTDHHESAQLRDDLVTLLVAGHDTIANALIWTWHLLAQHPKVEARLHEELQDVLDGRAPAFGDLQRLTYTNAVLTESLRLYPPAWVLTRRALLDEEIGGVLIPAGAIVVMSQYVTHRDARFFRDPLTFLPERWMGSARPASPRLAYFPFGAGPRSCIGQGLASLEGPLVLATIASRWRCRPLGEMDVDPRATLRPRGPVLVETSRVSPRARVSNAY
jgi:cytochrome P450